MRLESQGTAEKVILDQTQYFKTNRPDKTLIRARLSRILTKVNP